MTVIDVNIVKLALLLSKNAKNFSYLERNGCTDNDCRANRNLEKYRENAGNFEFYSALPAQQKTKNHQQSGQQESWQFEIYKNVFESICHKTEEFWDPFIQKAPKASKASKYQKGNLFKSTSSRQISIFIMVLSSKGKYFIVHANVHFLHYFLICPTSMKITPGLQKL